MSGIELDEQLAATGAARRDYIHDGSAGGG
jgi:hypothetical protein